MAEQTNQQLGEESISNVYHTFIDVGDRLVKKQGGKWVVIGVVIEPPTVDDKFAYFTVDSEDGAVRFETTARLGHLVPVILKSAERDGS